eukprot:CAMPEP_0181203528 /NCGR_PEP_ID=MMETSP1096-20121128/19437_1 /TAXON_ID=156174 ORGANISM="Chrysochromulina ericina, Strain CCMP281" /NCGR_SAMPLE_ID=MMETSP1096 /ASSEMBLY_ACC=CAM_ASM_000453 /LENGTH=49 /DNA_ID= /DNA_START= /DNA_END= /DNA_ORIENTATION=
MKKAHGATASIYIQYPDAAFVLFGVGHVCLLAGRELTARPEAPAVARPP